MMMMIGKTRTNTSVKDATVADRWGNLSKHLPGIAVTWLTEQVNAFAHSLLRTPIARLLYAALKGCHRTRDISLLTTASVLRLQGDCTVFQLTHPVSDTCSCA